MTEQATFIGKCDCCDLHILYMDISQMRGNHYEKGEPVQEGIYPIIDLTPKQIFLLRNQCNEAINNLNLRGAN